ncbi:anti-sigma-K factor RskA [Pararhizobium capsulatum DSM 1112]|uniref:Anti-sigma-K factor RskA n=1 Tax=Pararhizobium capsulatum DSM 1112 TaxID=1121113 RepID=A0ABU0BPJ1_9HYPH|nr:anti-sigma factor [Pararhizobium capsulatum]MDQ0318787.1 anti-sigma-K factor RskA [Pararhizobium capsulatum DSM 1112]
MSTQTPKRGDSQRDEVIAGEYVLGVLSTDDRRKVEARIVLDSNFAAMVNRWQTNLSSFDNAYEAVTPRPKVYATIERRLFDQPAPTETSGLWNSLAFWRVLTGLALAGLAAIAVLESVTFTAPQPPTAAPILAELSSEGNAVALFASYDPTHGKLTITPVAANQPEPRSLEVWMIEDGSAPKSLGVLPQSGEGEISIAPEMAQKLGAGVTLAVSLEPVGGSATGAPTGAVVAAGKTHLR